MARIEPLSVEEALVSGRPKQPSERSLRTHRIAADTRLVIDALFQKGAAIIDLEEQDKPVDGYLNSLRRGLLREGRTDVLVQRKRGQDRIVAWFRRPEDEARMAVRRATGARLGQLMKQRAAAGRGPR